jgi:aspartyl/asparaginyl-tRNA synthetase
MGFISDFEEVLETAQEFLKSTISNTWKEGSKDLEFLGATKPEIADKFPRITVKELHELMFNETKEDYRGERDITPSEEKFICEYSKKKWNSEAIFVTEFPWSDAKFYHYQNRKDPEVTDRADMLFRGVELASVTRREVGYQQLVKQIKDKGNNPEHPGLKYYLDAFKYGMPDEGGFGFGISRFVQKMIGLGNVKEAEIFPRDVQRITP